MRQPARVLEVIPSHFYIQYFNTCVPTSSLLKERSRMPIINGNKKERAEVLPMSYVWAHNYFRTGIMHRWSPEHNAMHIDIEQWRSSSILTTDEKAMFLFTVGFFAASNRMVMDNCSQVIYKHITNPECRQYLALQASEKALHIHTLLYVCDTLGLDYDYIHALPQTMTVLKSKLSFISKYGNIAAQPEFNPNNPKSIQKFLLNLIAHYVVLQGVFMSVGFTLMLGLKRRNKMNDAGELWELVMRDESLQVSFGSDVIKEIGIENKKVWTGAFKDTVTEMIEDAVEIEKEYLKKVCPHGTLGIDAIVLDRFVEYVADKRLEQIGLSKIYQQVNPFKWVGASLVGKERALERDTNDYRSGQLKV